MLRRLDDPGRWDVVVDQLPHAGDIQLDTTAVLFTLTLALAVGALVAIIPLAGLARLDLSAVFREEGRSGTASRGLRTLRRGMVVAQVAFALMLLVAAGLFMASFRQLLTVDTGFDPRGVLSGSVSLTPTGYPEEAELRAFAAEAVAAVALLACSDTGAARHPHRPGDSPGRAVAAASVARGPG